jgi:hypothetical protein
LSTSWTRRCKRRVIGSGPYGTVKRAGQDSAFMPVLD